MGAYRTAYRIYCYQDCAAELPDTSRCPCRIGRGRRGDHEQFGHVSGAMLSRYSHVRMEAKRRALDEIATRQNAADEKRKEDAKRVEQKVVPDSLVLQ